MFAPIGKLSLDSKCFRGFNKREEFQVLQKKIGRYKNVENMETILLAGAVERHVRVLDRTAFPDTGKGRVHNGVQQILPRQTRGAEKPTRSVRGSPRPGIEEAEEALGNVILGGK